MKTQVQIDDEMRHALRDILNAAKLHSSNMKTKRDRHRFFEKLMLEKHISDIEKALLAEEPPPA